MTASGRIDGLVRDTVGRATANAAAGQLPFAALVVADGAALAFGVNTVLRDGDPTSHAETEAVRAACRATGRLHLAGTTVYASAAPCAMCLAVMSAVGVDKVVHADVDPTTVGFRYPGPPTTFDRNAFLRRRIIEATGMEVRPVRVAGAEEPYVRCLSRLHDEQ